MRPFDEAREATDPERPTIRGRRVDYRVLGAVTSLVALVIVGIAISVWLILDLRRATIDLTEREIEYAAAVGDIRLISKTLANDERGYLISGSDEFLQQWEGRTAQVYEAFARAYDNADEEHWETVNQAKKGFDEWHEATEANFAVFAAGNEEAAIKASLDHTRPLRKAYESQLAGTERLAGFAIEAATDRVLSTLTRAVAILIGYLIVAVVLGGLIGLWVIQRAMARVDAVAGNKPSPAGLAPRTQPVRPRIRSD